MKNIFYTIITIVLFCSSSFGQSNQEELLNTLKQIQTLIAELPKGKHALFDIKFELNFDKDGKHITITNWHYEKGRKKKKKDHSTYTFDLSTLDPNTIIIEKFEYQKTFEIRFFAMNNRPTITQKISVKRQIKATSSLDRVTMGSWSFDNLIQIEKIKTLFSKAILNSLNGNVPTNSKTTTEPKWYVDIPKENNEEGPVFAIVETMPLFQNSADRDKSEKLVRKYIRKRIKADTYNSKGVVYVNCVIDKSGKTTKVKILRGVNSELDELAKKYIIEMPNWSPGVQRGKKVNVNYNVAVRFK
ncbi:energy transducer TonB [Flavobacteriales bacterium]|nr:energy transducer TonB [Flavobacteriales bacterium]